MKRYDDINKLFDVINITEDYAIINIEKDINYTFFFKIEPLIILNNSDKYVGNILNSYEEFLRGINLDIQIIMKNKKIEYLNYINMNSDSSNLKNELMQEYIKNMKKLLEDTNVFSYVFYLIIKSPENVENVEKYVLPLKNTGMSVKRIYGIDKIKKFIMEEMK